MIETKESQWKSNVNVAMPHNNVHIITASTGGGSYLNIFKFFTLGPNDEDMGTGNGQRVGDQINVRRVVFKMFLENALNRSKVYYRFMLVRCAKGDLPTRATLFKNNADNKMIDMINTERFSIVYQKIFNITPTNLPPIAVAATGSAIGATDVAGIATRVVTCSIPGRKFGRKGKITFENGSSQVKFYDYVPLFVCYDWYGTPQDVNNVGRINELYSKIYFKDA